jgi:acetyltransferase-like isoleucine patch superfamily enzyme
LSKNGITLGNNVSVGKNTTIECTGSIKYLGLGLSVGNDVSHGTHGFWGCAGGIEIGDDTIFGNYVSLHSENHNFDLKDIPIRLQGVNREGIKIGNNCWVGAKVTILDGVVIENGCVIAAGALLTKGIYKENSIYGGVPAKFLKNRFNEK